MKANRTTKGNMRNIQRRRRRLRRLRQSKRNLGQLGERMKHGPWVGGMTSGMQKVGHGIATHTMRIRTVCTNWRKDRILVQTPLKRLSKQQGRRNTPKSLSRRSQQNVRKKKKMLSPRRKPKGRQALQQHHHILAWYVNLCQKPGRNDFKRLRDSWMDSKQWKKIKHGFLRRGRLQDVASIRLNVYHNRPAVGLHDRIEKRDIAYFRSPGAKCPDVFHLAALLKAAEMMAARKHLYIFLLVNCGVRTWYIGIFGESANMNQPRCLIELLAL